MKILAGISILVFLMMFGCTLFEESTSDLDKKIDQYIEEKNEIYEETVFPHYDPEVECEYRYWFDNNLDECGYQEFCGAYMYYGLMTFETLEECEKALNEREIEEEKEDIDPCIGLENEEKWDCLILLAENEKNISICSQINPYNERNLCIRSLAFILRDLNECDNLISEGDQRICRAYITSQDI